MEEEFAAEACAIPGKMPVATPAQLAMLTATLNVVLPLRVPRTNAAVIAATPNGATATRTEAAEVSIPVEGEAVYSGKVFFLSLYMVSLVY